MGSRVDMSCRLLEHGFQVMMSHLREIQLEEALFVPEGGYRSVLGTLKHAAGWSHVYRSYAFDPEPKHWDQIDWPYGLRDTIIKNQEYLEAIIVWFERGHQQWMDDLSRLEKDQPDEPRPVHWGETAPLSDIVMWIASHHNYHAGELNQVLSICRGEAWEEGEEVEENNVCTAGHRVVPPWKRESGD